MILDLCCPKAKLSRNASAYGRLPREVGERLRMLSFQLAVKRPPAEVHPEDSVRLVSKQEIMGFWLAKSLHSNIPVTRVYECPATRLRTDCSTAPILLAATDCRPRHTYRASLSCGLRMETPKTQRLIPTGVKSPSHQ